MSNKNNLTLIPNRVIDLSWLIPLSAAIIVFMFSNEEENKWLSL